jgi:hypothetical protein
LGSFCVKKTDTLSEHDLCNIHVFSQLRPKCFLQKLGSFGKKRARASHYELAGGRSAAFTPLHRPQAHSPLVRRSRSDIEAT